MKKQTEINFSKISKEQTKKLTTLEGESLVTNYVPFKTFTLAELWNIHRRSKPMVNRRHLV